MITDDLHHDKFAVRAFEKQTLDHLKAKGFIPTQIIQFVTTVLVNIKAKGHFSLFQKVKFPFWGCSLVLDMAKALQMEL